MNFIAHLLLSGNNEGLIVGNYIGDAVKGRSYLEYKKDIQEGIIMHRQIDKFTDEHPVNKSVKKLFIPEYHKYSAIVVDLVYDYFLCENWDKYSPSIDFDEFVKKIHKILLNNLILMPTKMQKMLPSMIAHKSLKSYSNLEGLKKTLDRMAKHKNLPNVSEFAIKTVIDNENFINRKFIVFFDDILKFTNSKIWANKGL